MARLIGSVAVAAALINRGLPIAFPTETVYGLGADASDEDACSQIYRLKGRPSINPLIVHVASLEQAMEIGHFSPLALSVVEKFWPGPLTVVVKKKDNAQIAKNVTAGLSTVAIRVPSHPIALELINLSGKMIAAPSGNISNYVSATSASHVMDDFPYDDFYILSSNDSQNLGLESTIVDFSGDEPKILRHGVILAEDMNISFANSQDNARGVKAPGMLLKHYSPRSKLYINASVALPDAACIDFNGQIESQFTLSKTGDLTEAAVNLYTILRQADFYAMQQKYYKIVVASVPNIGLGIAINDKLTRAAN
jgi:L-threonylcarbamoyladenylate synthase